MASKARSLRSDKGDQLVTRAQVVAAIRHMVEHDLETRAQIAVIAASVRKPSLWRRIVGFFRVGR